MRRKIVKDYGDDEEVFEYPEEGYVGSDGMSRIVKKVSDLPLDELMEMDRYNCIVGKFDDGEDIQPEVWDLEIF